MGKEDDLPRFPTVEIPRQSDGRGEGEGGGGDGTALSGVVGRVGAGAGGPGRLTLVCVCTGILMNVWLLQGFLIFFRFLEIPLWGSGMFIAYSVWRRAVVGGCIPTE